MNEKQFEQLRLHLGRVLPNIENFCIEAGYEFVNQKSLGRYPRIRIERTGEINRWIELWMELDEDGNRYEHYFEEIPYELSAGAYINIPDHTEYGHRFQKSFLLFSRKKFKDIPTIITTELKKANEKLAGWNRNILINEGKRVDFG